MRIDNQPPGFAGGGAAPPVGAAPPASRSFRHGRAAVAGSVAVARTVRITMSSQMAGMEVKGRAQNDKTRAPGALKHVVVLHSNTSILAICEL